MHTSPSRKKQPDLVRAQLLAAAARIAVEQGLASITLDAVAKMAGVSKGGLLYHYPSRRALIDALYADLLARLDTHIHAAMAADPLPSGRFTRAYLTAVTESPDNTEESRLLGAAALAMSTDLQLAETWNTWINRHLLKYGEEERTPAAAAIRYAADGIWLADCTHAALPAKIRSAVVKHLEKQTLTLSPIQP